MDGFVQKSRGCMLLMLTTFAVCLLGGVPTPTPFSASTSTTNTVLYPEEVLSSSPTTSPSSLPTTSPSSPPTTSPSSLPTTSPSFPSTSPSFPPTTTPSSPPITSPSSPPTTSTSFPPTTSPSSPPTTSPSFSSTTASFSLPPTTSPSFPSTTYTSSPPTTSSSSPPTTSSSSFPTTSPSFPYTTSPSSPPTTSPSYYPSPKPLPPSKTTLSPWPTPAHRPMPPLPQTAPPLFDRQPFTVSWNIPELVCNRYNITLDNSPFRGVATPAKVPGQFLALFYTDRLGLYPRVDRTGERHFNGGIPQRGDLGASLAKAHADIIYYIPSRSRRGLAVIDWEEWRPLWVRNWGSKHIYKTLSVSHARQKNPSLNPLQAASQAKKHFQAAARSFMYETLSLGRRLRPNYLWGFYLFPNCYNHGWLEPGYTGRCSRQVRAQNNKLRWLWEASTALYPSVYLQASLGDSPSAALLVRNRVHEALRVSALPKHHATAPVFVYTRPVFVDRTRRFLSQRDLISTIGESAALGASGSVMWGASTDYNTKASCEALSSYLTTTLNPYIANVTTAAQLCSDFLCQGNGRCVRRRYNSDHYLHLHPGNFRILHSRGRYRALGRPTAADLRFFANRFTCQCYAGLTCSPQLPKHLPKALLHRNKKAHNSKTKTGRKKVTFDMEQSSNFKEKVNKRQQLKQ